MSKKSIRVVESEATESEKARTWRGGSYDPPPTAMVWCPTDEVVEDETASAIRRRSMEREWKQLHRRYGQLPEFWRLVQSDIGDEAEA